ncbi:F-actin-capping protein subunit alpha [Polychaeton citri CBS 116435]|uniref:F-actin-capping protein subunit alpha n=1 Tax=Polychaeton citri CBS 116435 TaxID=1314669 RepID=A0A9P4Q1U9_9PEZI|nr:F-actin-capping protein subunit alpha [Polychaeton citri CBS 116435]
MSKEATVSSFVETAPPGELSNVISDIKALTSDNPSVLKGLDSALKKYNEAQYATVRLPGSSGSMLISEHNSLGDNRYFDSASETSFVVDHATQKASDAQSYPLDSKYADLIKSLLKSFASYASEHFPSSVFGIFPSSDDNKVIICLVANKYSPQNFWNGRWRSTYTVDRSSLSVNGTIKVDVHYYEDGNVRMSTSKEVELRTPGDVERSIVSEIVRVEKRFQEELNRAFVSLSEGSFKGLRRQLPVTRQRVEWEKIGGYRLGQDIGGGRSK